MHTDKPINFLSLNIRGLGGKKKSRTVFDWLNKIANGVTFLQETHSNIALAETWESYWKGKIYCAHGNTNSKGVAILFHPNIQHEVIESIEDVEGRFLILKVKIDNETLVLVNCYLPTKDKERDQCVALSQLVNILCNYSEESFIIGGDFNISLNLDLEKFGGRMDPKESNKFRTEVQGMLLSFNLEDIIRNALPEEKIYTWHNNTKGISSRLDYWFVSDHLLNRVTKCNVKPSLFTDHDRVHFTLQPPNKVDPRGPGYWKFNTSFLKNLEYVALIKKEIKKELESIKHYNDKGLAWDYLKMKIRTASIKFAKSYYSNQRMLENNLVKRLEQIQTEHTISASIEKLDEINIIKKELEQIQHFKTDGAILRSKIQNIEEGERNTSFFLSLEKKNAEKKNLVRIQTNTNGIVSKQSAISAELLTFYKTLYTETNMIDHDDSVSQFLIQVRPTLSEQQQLLCEGNITETECLSALKSLKNGKTPGIDGFQAEFYKFFWIDIKQTVLSSLNYALVKNELSLDQRRGLISLIPKKDKDRLFVKNWRPITLLTTDYKLIAKCLALRMVKVIDKIISHDQTGYIKGRYIGENIRTIHDMITYLNKHKRSGMLLLIDFEKAFDTVKWTSIDKALIFFNFGDSFRNWVKILYSNAQSAVLNNGHLTEFFSPTRGVRQGCPLSAYLFILVAELLAIKLREDKNIEGIKISGAEIKISQLADDTSLFISTTDSIAHVFKHLKSFCSLSGLKANTEKTKFHNIGATEFKAETMHGFHFTKENIELLGITISTDPKISEDKNFRPRIRAIQNILKLWSRRKLSLKGKITIINALALSLIVYPATVLQTPVHILEEINLLLYSFLWDGKRPKIAAKVLENSIKLGGLKMPNIFLKVKAWQFSWLTRAYRNQNSNWLLIVNDLIGRIKLTDLIYCDLNPEHQILDCVPVFYKQILLTWYQLKHSFNNKDVVNQTLWFNKNITIENKPIYWHEWYRNGILFVRDIHDANGDFYDQDKIEEKYSIQTNFLSILQLRQSLPFTWREVIRNSQFPPPLLEPEIQVTASSRSIAITKLKTRQVYWMLIDVSCHIKKVTPKSIAKWKNIFPVHDNEWSNIFCLPFCTYRSTKLQSFQYRLLHRVITCNHWLFKAKIKDSPNCEKCNIDDSIEHFFLKCTDVQPFWTSLNKWWNRVTKNLLQPIVFTDQDILLGMKGSENYVNALNFILTLSKKYIHDLKMLSKQNISLLAFLVTLKQHLSYEKNICFKNDCAHSFTNNWSWLYDQL